jgi:hypothetical protein
MAYQILSGKLTRVEYLVGYEGEDFSFLEDAKKELLAITSVHPMSDDAVERFLDQAKMSWELISKLIEKGEISEVEYKGRKFYCRRFGRPKPESNEL